MTSNDSAFNLFIDSLKAGKTVKLDGSTYEPRPDGRINWIDDESGAKLICSISVFGTDMMDFAESDLTIIDPDCGSEAVTFEEKEAEVESAIADLYQLSDLAHEMMQDQIDQILTDPLNWFTRLELVAMSPNELDEAEAKVFGGVK